MFNIWNIDHCSRIGPSKNKTHFFDVSMQDISASLSQAVGINRQVFKISMPELFSGILTICRVVKIAIRIHTFIRSVFQFSVPYNIADIIMCVVVHKRYGFAIVCDERILCYSPAIRAPNAKLCCPSGKIIIFGHFVLLIPLLLLPVPRIVLLLGSPDRSLQYCYYATRLLSGRRKVSIL